MEFKKIIILLSFSTIITFGAILGVSYGWYAYSNAESDVTANTIKEAPSVIFEQTEYIFSTVNMPIYDEDRYNYGNKNSFIITLGENLKDYETGIQISLQNIAMSNELKISNYKYELLQDGNIISSGSFDELKSNELSLLPMTIINPLTYPQTYSYELYIWLSEDGTDQNNLMNRTFSAKVNVNSAIKNRK